MNPRRIRKAMKVGFEVARRALVAAREAKNEGNVFAMKVALEEVKYQRKINADRRRALRTGKLV